MLVTVKDVYKAYGALTVLDTVSFTVNKTDRVGIVGANGAGKSTLLRLLASHEEADAGTIIYAPLIQYGYLPQTTPPFYGHTIQDLIFESVGNLRQMEDRIQELAEAMEVASAEQLSRLFEEYTAISTRFQDSGGYDLDHKIAAVLAGLHISYLTPERKVETLSSGEKTRLGLAMLLLRSPDLLLLDEPTNHLDLASMTWLENFLSTYRGAVLIASHDRQFLNRTVTHIYEIDEYEHRLTCYVGDYDAYVTAKATKRKQWEKDYELQQEQLEELRKFILLTGKSEHTYRASMQRDKYARFGSFQNVQGATARNIRAAQVQLEYIEAHLLPKPPQVLPVTSYFLTKPLETEAVLFTISHLTKRRDERYIFHDLNLIISANARIILVGPNGVGKTTFLKLLLGLDKPTDGVIQVLANRRIGYLPQEPTLPDLQQTVIETYRNGLEGFESELIAQLLSYGLFRQDDITKQVGQLSIGQQRKLEIACLIAARPDVLLLDEPTNYISLDVLEAFEAAIIAFQGPIIVTSHDRSFIERFKGEVWEITAPGQIVKHHPSSRNYLSTNWRDIA